MGRRRISSAGVTLIEIMVAVAVAAVVLVIAVPSFTDFIDRSKVATLSSDLSAAFFLARGEAIKRGRNVMVGPRNADEDGCWQDLVVFVDLDQDESLDSGEPVLRAMDSFPKQVSLCPQTADEVVFRAAGDAQNAAELTLILQGKDDAKLKRRLCVRGSGQVEAIGFLSSCSGG